MYPLNSKFQLWLLHLFQLACLHLISADWTRTQTKWAEEFEAHQTGVDGRRLAAVREVVGVVVAGGGRGGVRGAVHPQCGVELRAAARQEPVVVGRAAEGGGGALGAARPVRHRPGNRIAASRSGVCRHEKLREENRGHTKSLSALAGLTSLCTATSVTAGWWLLFWKTEAGVTGWIRGKSIWSFSLQDWSVCAQIVNRHVKREILFSKSKLFDCLWNVQFVRDVLQQ